jgi:hypothetical protein
MIPLNKKEIENAKVMMKENIEVFKDIEILDTWFEDILEKVGTEIMRLKE